MSLDASQLPLREQIAELINQSAPGTPAGRLEAADDILALFKIPADMFSLDKTPSDYFNAGRAIEQSQDAPSCTNPTCTCSDRQQQGCVCKEADCSHFDGAACQNCGCAIPNTAEPLSDDLRIVVVTRAERGFTADVYGDFNSYGAAKKWAEANIAKKIGYDLKPVTVIAIQSEESIPMPQRDMIEAILRAKDHCAYKPDADRLQWAAEFISKQRPTIPRLQHVQPEKGEEN